MRKITVVFAFAVLMLGAGLTGSTALAKCPGACRKLLAHEMIACKRACGRGRAANPCRKACVGEHLSDLQTCKAAVNPTPPNCGESSPSGAFLDESSE